MKLQQRINAFAQLGDFLSKFLNKDVESSSETSTFSNYFGDLNSAIARAKVMNPWFTEENIKRK